jgi:heme/copper-type cytochrome/quinol oxidase subunit 2
LTSIDAKIVSLQNDTATIKTSLGIIDGKVTSILNNTATIKTSLGDVSISMGDVKATENLAGSSLSNIAIAAVIIVIVAVLLITVLRRFRKAKSTE